MKRNGHPNKCRCDFCGTQHRSKVVTSTQSGTPTFKVTGTSDRERRAYRRAVLERLASQQEPPREPTDLSVAQGARILLQEFENGDEHLFGFPRALVDFPRAYELLDEYDTDEMRTE